MGSACGRALLSATGINFQACSFNHAPTPSGKNAIWHNARHRRAQEFRRLFASVPKRFRLHCEIGNVFGRI